MQTINHTSELIEIFGKKFTLARCTEADIPSHFETIRQWVIVDTNELLFKVRMKKCVAAGTAFKINDSDCFMYYFNTKPKIAEGVAFYGRGATQAIMAMVIGIFDRADKKTFTITFQLHEGKSVNEYRSILTRSSLHSHLTKGTPVVVRIDKLLKKYKKLTGIN